MIAVVTPLPLYPRAQAASTFRSNLGTPPAWPVLFCKRYNFNCETMSFRTNRNSIWMHNAICLPRIIEDTIFFLVVSIQDSQMELCYFIFLLDLNSSLLVTPECKDLGKTVSLIVECALSKHSGVGLWNPTANPRDQHKCLFLCTVCTPCILCSTYNVPLLLVERIIGQWIWLGFIVVHRHVTIATNHGKTTNLFVAPFVAIKPCHLVCWVNLFGIRKQKSGTYISLRHERVCLFNGFSWRQIFLCWNIISGTGMTFQSCPDENVTLRWRS